MKVKEIWKRVKKFFTKEVSTEVIDLGPLADCEIEVCSNGLINLNEILDGGQTVFCITDIPIDHFVDYMNFVHNRFLAISLSKFIITNRHDKFAIMLEDDRKILPNVKIYTRYDSQIVFALAVKGDLELVRDQSVLGMSAKMTSIITKIKEAQMRLSKR